MNLQHRDGEVNREKCAQSDEDTDKVKGADRRVILGQAPSSPWWIVYPDETVIQWK